MPVDILSTPDLQPLLAFLTSLGIGLLIGLERERSPAAKAGLRTFALVALAGTLGAMLSEHTGAPWVLGAGLMILGGMMVAMYFKDSDETDPGTTTIAAVVVCYGLGALVWYGQPQLAVTLAILVTVLLYFKAELEQVSKALTRTDLVSILQFAVLSFVVLPVVPDQGFGPYKALNPYHVWWMVVLVSGLSLAGYAALRLAGEKHGTLLTGLFGGVASSTATTLAFSRHGRRNPMQASTAAMIILLANWMVLIRLGIMVAVVSPGTFSTMAPVLGAGLLTGTVVLYGLWRKMEAKHTAPEMEITNPTEIKSALGFGLLFSGVLLAAAFLTDWLGSRGAYVVALVSGLTDVDAITLSSLRLAGLGTLTAREVTTTVMLAELSNITFKTSLTLFIGGRALARQVLPGFAAVAAGLVLGWGLS